MLIKTLSLKESILNDLKIFTLARRDAVSIYCKYTYEWINTSKYIQNLLH